MDKGIARAVIVLGVLLALGMSTAAFLLGNQARHIGAGRQSITVKGLAEKPVQADHAEWRIGVQVYGQTFADALARLRKERPMLSEFLARQGFGQDSVKELAESVTPNMVEEELPNGRSRSVQKGYNASQDVVVNTKDLDRAAAAAKAALQLEADDRPVFYSAPLYLVSGLEEIKMSLIGAATQNAQKRAEEFAKNGNVHVGAMRSASQGAFYILAPGANVEASEYGGTYDKTTVDKIARVVVTIEYSIEK
jgi:uncharacterized protein